MLDNLRQQWRTPTDRFLRRWVWALLVVNVVITLTGAAVRLTASGLGCPTWPRCTDESFVPHGALGVHGAIEFGNRMLTYVVVAVAVGAWLAVRRATAPGDVRRTLATAIALGVPLQAVIGGISVLTDLNPWVVALHLVVSMSMIAASTVLLGVVGRAEVAPDADEPAVPRPMRQLAWSTYAALWVVVYAGTVVTGSGPHAGDLEAPRNGLSPVAVSQLHADVVFLLVGLTLASVFALRAVDAPARLVRAAVVFLGIELAQGLVGFVQYWTDLPIVLVWFHLLGAAVLVAVGTAFVHAVTRAGRDGSRGAAAISAGTGRSRR